MSGTGKMTSPKRRYASSSVQTTFKAWAPKNATAGRLPVGQNGHGASEAVGVAARSHLDLERLEGTLSLPSSEPAHESFNHCWIARSQLNSNNGKNKHKTPRRRPASNYQQLWGLR